MTTQVTKTWFVDGKIIEQVIPESEIYKREWVGLTCIDYAEICRAAEDAAAALIRAEAKLKGKNA